MKDLLYKELRLSLHPTQVIFLLFAAMLFIPSYPYYTVFFYSGLSIFFTCLTGRENHDIYYTCLLPVKRSDAVKSRICFAVIFQLLEIILCIPVILIKKSLPMPQNPVGMEANAAFLGLSLVLLGIFNITFFPQFYKNILKVGIPFVISGAAIFGYILIVEAMCHVVPFFKDIDSVSSEHLSARLAVFGAGAAIYVLLTLAAYKLSVKNFTHQDM